MPHYKEINKRVEKKRNIRSEKQEAGKERRTMKSVTTGCLVCLECKQCSGQQETYTAQAKAKQAWVSEVMEPFCKLQPMITMEKPTHYKNRVHKMFRHEKNGTPYSGNYSEKDRRVIKIEECYIEDKKCQEIIGTIKGLLKSFKIKIYDVKSGYGLLRYVYVRRGTESNEIMVVLVLSSNIMPSKNNFVKELRRLHPEISTILINENYKDATNILGDKETAIYGKGFILDTMCDKTFRISSKSQFPMNPVQTKKVCETIVSWGEFKGNELVLDAYCGIGTNSLILSDHVRKIFSVEASNEMFRDTISNIKRNQIKNIDVYKNDPADFLMQVANSNKEKIDVVVAAQPFNGCGQPFIDAIATAKPKKLILTARNSKSLAKELELFAKKGYRVKKAVAVDVMPWTDKVEVIVLLMK